MAVTARERTEVLTMRLIDAEKLEEQFGISDADILAKEEIRFAPTVDAVVVTRCKDCEKSAVTEFGKRYCKEPMGRFFGCIPVEDDYFCSGGRRKDGKDG